MCGREELRLNETERTTFELSSMRKTFVILFFVLAVFFHPKQYLGAFCLFFSFSLSHLLFSLAVRRVIYGVFVCLYVGVCVMCSVVFIFLRCRVLHLTRLSESLYSSDIYVQCIQTYTTHTNTHDPSIEKKSSWERCHLEELTGCE